MGRRTLNFNTTVFKSSRCDLSSCVIIHLKFDLENLQQAVQPESDPFLLSNIER